MNLPQSTDAIDSSEEQSTSDPGMFASLAVRDFRFLWFSNLAATFAMQMQMVARGWLIYDMTNSPLALTWVMLSFMLPMFLFSLAGGVVADRARKKVGMLVIRFCCYRSDLDRPAPMSGDVFPYLFFEH